MITDKLLSEIESKQHLATQAEVIALVAEVRRFRAWPACPECGSPVASYGEVSGQRHCLACQQEWYTDCHYADAVSFNLRRLKSLLALCVDRLKWIANRDSSGGPSYAPYDLWSAQEQALKTLNDVFSSTSTLCKWPGCELSVGHEGGKPVEHCDEHRLVIARKMVAASADRHPDDERDYP